MALTESTQVALGTSIHPFNLKGVDDKAHTVADYKPAKVLAVIFMCNHCPYVQAVIDRLVTIQKDYADKGVQMVGINSNDDLNYPEDNFENMKKFSQERGMNFPYLRDDTQEVARLYGAVCTPDIFVYDVDRLLRYHGRIDDNWKDPSHATKHELREALDAILEGREIPFEPKPSMGCSIKWK